MSPKTPSPLQSIEAASHAVAELLDIVRVVAVVLENPYPKPEPHIEFRRLSLPWHARTKFDDYCRRYAVPEDSGIEERCSRLLKRLLPAKHWRS